MKKASSLLFGVGSITMFCGMAGLDGPTPLGCIIVTLTGAVVFIGGITLNAMDKMAKLEQAKELSEQEQRKSEFIKVWQACQMQ